MCGNEFSKVDGGDKETMSFKRKAKEFDYSLRDEIMQRSIIHKGNQSFQSFVSKPSASYYIYDDGYRFFNSIVSSNPEIRERQGEIYFPKWSEYIFSPISTGSNETLIEGKSKKKKELNNNKKIRYLSDKFLEFLQRKDSTL